MRLSLLFLFSFYASLASAQSHHLSGTVRSKDGRVIPFASIYVTTIKKGTSTNAEGSFNLPLLTGEYQITASAVGYRSQTQPITLNKDQTLYFNLEEERYQLEEVVIGNQEDPAYVIIRKAIKQRPIHLNESGPYRAQVYIKGLQRMLKAPKKFLGMNIDDMGQEMGLDSNRRGIIYLSESQSNITVNPPKGFREEMISSKVSGNNRAFSFNRAADLQLNFYENLQAIVDGLSSRHFVSPIADNALNYYRYTYLGQTKENGLTIHKIKVIPKRKAEPLYKGDLYIIEGSWRIHSLNLVLDKDAGINLVDTLTIKQLFNPISPNCWLPGNIQLNFTAGLLGFRIAGYFIAFYENYHLLDSIDKKQFKETLHIAKGINEKDSAYWALNRPIPLSSEEKMDYQKKDSLQQRRSSKSYLDSLDRKNNRFKPTRFLLGGYGYRDRYRQSYFYAGAPASAFLFNTVEGLAINYPLSYSKQLDSTLNRYLRIQGRIRYGFSNRHLNGNLGISFPIQHHQLYLAGGSDVLDLNNRGSVSPLLNGVYTLFLGENYLKLYEKTFGTAQWTHTLPGNIRINAGIEWARRHALSNSTDYTFWDRNRHKLTSNNPLLPNDDTPIFGDNEAATFTVGASYNFSNRYETYPQGKRYLPSPYPTFSIQYTKGIPDLLGSDVDYDLLATSLTKTDNNLGLYGKISYTLSAGKFLNRTQTYYPDFRHFNGNQILIVDQQLTSFLGLGYYRYSTPNAYIEAHTEYNVSGLLTSKVPLLRKLKLEELVGLHYLHTSELDQYGELHLGLQWKAIRLMYSRSFSTSSALDKQNYIRIGIKLF